MFIKKVWFILLRFDHDVLMLLIRESDGMLNYVNGLVFYTIYFGVQASVLFYNVEICWHYQGQKWKHQILEGALLLRMKKLKDFLNHKSNLRVTMFGGSLSMMMITSIY